MNNKNKPFGKLTLLLSFTLAACADVNESNTQNAEANAIIEDGQVATRTPLDFSIREPFRNEHGYTHYFPTETWGHRLRPFAKSLRGSIEGRR